MEYNDIQTEFPMGSGDKNQHYQSQKPCHESHFGSNQCLAIFRWICLAWFSGEVIWIIVDAASSGQSFSEFVASFKFLTQQNPSKNFKQL